MIVSRNNINNIDIITGQNDHLRFDVAPVMGGKIISVYNKKLKKEFLWSNNNLPLAVNAPGADYDANFWGGIDELIPNDMQETIDGIQYPDHGELWTTPLEYRQAEEALELSGQLKLSGLWYKKVIRLEVNAPVIVQEYTIRNDSGARRHFLWKLHAALMIKAGDKLDTSARNARVIDPDYSRFNSLAEFTWPFIEGINASVIPPKNDTVDFFYLYNTPRAVMQLLTENGKHVFSYRYDKNIFPYQWFFASYGKFLDHYTAILEPCTNMPMSVNEAIALGQCAVLEPGQQLTTTVRIYAGEYNQPSYL